MTPSWEAIVAYAENDLILTDNAGSDLRLFFMDEV